MAGRGRGKKDPFHLSHKKTRITESILAKHARMAHHGDTTATLYDQIIGRVIEDSRERFEAEGADMQVLGELQKVRPARGLPATWGRASRASESPAPPLPAAPHELHFHRQCARRTLPGAWCAVAFVTHDP